MDPLTQDARIALATCAELPQGDPDDAPLLAAFEARGLDVAWYLWDDPGVDWAGFDAVLIRSTWDYQFRRDEFLDWAARVPSLWNPADLVRWNTDKRYLAELEQAGIAVVGTTFVEPGEEVPELPGRGEIVVKPSVSAGSRDTARFRTGDRSERAAAIDLVAEIHAGGRTAMLQPYLSAVDAAGETALIHFGGEFSHSIRKGPLLVAGAGPTDGFFAPETIEPRAATAAERELGERAVAFVAERFGMPAYARVDVVPGEDGTPILLEVELTEPSLFFLHAEGSAERFVAEICRRLA